GAGIEDGRRKNPIPVGEGRNRGNHDRGLVDLGPLIGAEKPGAVFLDRAAQRAAEFVVDQRWLRPWRREEVSGGDVAVSQKVERRAVNLVRAALGDYRD